LSQHQLALQLGITAGAVGQWDLRRNLPNMTTFDRLATVLGVSRDWLLTGEDDEERGIAQDETEKRTLITVRDLSIEDRLSVIAYAEALIAGYADGPRDSEATAHIVERYKRLPKEGMRSFDAILEGLARTYDERLPRKNAPTDSVSEEPKSEKRVVKKTKQSAQTPARLSRSKRVIKTTQ
jgi:transcriptional regulator with XRE-family HTH domain